MNQEIDFEEFAPWLVLIITFVGGALRLIQLDMRGMGLDEALSVWLSSNRIVDMLQWVTKIDQHPPLYYILLHFWMALTGHKLYDVRFLSVLFSTGTIPVIYLIGKRVAGTATGIAAAVILSFSLFNISYAQETRVYSLLAFNAAVAIYALVRLLTDPRSVRPIGSQFREYMKAWRTPGTIEPVSSGDFSYRAVSSNRTGWNLWVSRHHWLPIQAVETDLAWVTWIIFSVATLLSDNTAVLFTLATNIFVLGLIVYQRTQKNRERAAFQPPSMGNWAKAQLGIFLLWLPWMFFFIKQASAVYQRFWIPEPTWDTVVQVTQSLLITPAPLRSDSVTVVWSMYILVVCLGLIYFRKSIAKLLFLVALFVIPFLGELVVSIWRPIFGDSTLIWTTIPLILLLAAGITTLRYRFLMVFGLGSLVTLSLFFTTDYYRSFQKEDWLSAARTVAVDAEKDDLILFNSNLAEIPFNYYFDPIASYRDIQVEKRGVPLDLFESGIPEPGMAASDISPINGLLNGHKRVWLVYSRSFYTDPMGLLPQMLASQKKLIKTDDFRGGQVFLYESQ